MCQGWQVGFSIGVGEQDGLSILTCSGELDAASAPRVAEALGPLTSVPGCHPIIDLSGVDFIDSVGLGVIVTGLKHAREAEGGLRVVVSTPRVLRVFQLTGLDIVIPLHETLADAIAHAR